MERAVDIVDDGVGRDAGASIWLNRNGRGDIFKPGKVWCLGVRVWVGCRGVGRASHKFTLSYHQMATIPVLGSRGPSQE
ncbi:hypothetical protein K0M31_019434, partial [Melipona bicolor]